jgi:phenylacetic acid degradation operon negative regulatory protein
MAKKLRLRDRLLLGIAFIDEVLDATVGAGARAYHAGRLGFWTPKNYKGSALRQNIYRMLKTGYLEKKIKDGQPVLVISKTGRQQLARHFSYFRLQSKKWDKYWRLVIFDISEKQKSSRDALRRKLVELGFGQWQKSIYISPFDIEEDMVEFLAAQKLFGQAYVLTAKHRLIGDARELASKVWPLEKINKRYWQIIAELEVLNKLPSLKQASELKKICHDYYQALLLDPCLPKELLPLDWGAKQCRIMIGKAVAAVTSNNAIA